MQWQSLVMSTGQLKFCTVNMENEDMRLKVKRSVIRHLAQTCGEFYVPAAVSNRHIHLSAGDVEALFGKGCQLQVLRDLSQPGQYACKETLTVIGPKGKLENVRVLGPARGKTQVEVSITDTFLLGVEPVVRMSGDTAGTPGCRIAGPAGEVLLAEGVIAAARHLHISLEEAQAYGVSNGEVVQVVKEGVRETVFGNVVVRADAAFALELHLDTDEANAAQIKNGDLLRLVKRHA